jgi:hypothetical protein
MRAAAALGPNTEIPAGAQPVGDPCHERNLGADHRKLDVERLGQREQPVDVVRPRRVALPECRDPRVPRGSMELRSLKGPRQRVLAPPRADDQHPHAPSIVAPRAA